MKPACMDIAEYRRWLEVRGDEVVTPCADCTREFAAEMADVHLCLIWDGDQWVLGRKGRRTITSTERHRLWRAGLLPTLSEKHQQRMRRAEQAAGMYAAGMSKMDIARELGIARSSVYALLELVA